MNYAVPVFRSQLLSSSQVITGGSVQAQGNKVVLAATVISYGATATAYIDGSYDGVAWAENIAAGGLSLNQMGIPSTPTISKSSLDYAFVRVRVVAGAGSIIFDATLVFSQQ